MFGCLSAFWSGVSPPLGVSAFWSGSLHPLISKWHWLQKPKSQLSPGGVVSIIWSASNTDFKNLSLGVYTFWSGCLYLWVSQLFDQGVSTFWSASNTDFKNLSSNFHWWVVSIFWSASDNDFKNLSSNFQEGELSLPFDHQVTHWLQKPKFGCLCLLIRVSPPLGVCSFLIRVFHYLISKWHWLQKPKFQLSGGGSCLHLLISKWHTDFKNLSLGVSATFHQECRSLVIHHCDTYFKWHTDCKNLSLVVSLFIRVSLPLGVFTYWSGCHCLLIS